MPIRTRNKTKTMTRTLLVVAAAWQLRATPLASAGAPPAQLCEAAKLKAASTFAQCRGKADSVYAAKGDAAKRQASYDKCEANLAKGYGKAEEKYGAECPTVGDATDVRDYLSQCTNDVGAATQPGGAVPDYVVELAACNTSLSSTQAQLTTCTGDKTTCQGSLATAQAGTATAGQVLTGRTFTSTAGIGATGTMPNNGAVTITPGTASQAIAAGYHNGSGTVAGDANLAAGNIKSGTSIFGVNGTLTGASGTATASQVLSGSTFSNSSGASTGTMPNNGAVTITPGTTSQTIAAGYHNGSGSVAGDANLVPSNIKSGTSIFGVAGTGALAFGNGLLTTGQTTSYGAGSDGNLQKGTSQSFTDNGNGTVTDNRTGLVWAKKSDDGSIHDKDNTYTWGQNVSPYSMNGTMVTTYLTTLNTPPCFAGACDWRMPNLEELESIRNLETFNPATFAAFNTSCTAGCTVTACSCTVSSYYWSSSTYRNSPGGAWSVYFGSGDVYNATKTGGNYVRAVRGGS